MKAQTEPTEEKPAVEGAAAEEEKAPPAPVEPEEKTLTLEEYYAQRKKSNRNPNARQQEEKVGYVRNIFFTNGNFRKLQPTSKLKEPRRAVLLVSRKLTSSQLQSLAEEVTTVEAADVEVVAVVTVVQVTDHETTKPR